MVSDHYLMRFEYDINGCHRTIATALNLHIHICQINISPGEGLQ